MCVSRRNTSGQTGVIWDKSRGKWKVSITDSYKVHNAGYFLCLEEAIKVRKSLEVKFGYHKNHGRTAAV